MHPFKQSVIFYARNIEYLLLLAFAIVLPFSLLHTFVTNYVYFWTVLTDTNAFGDVVNTFYMLLFFFVGQLPFVQYVQSEVEGEEKGLRRAFRTFFVHGFSVFLFGLLYVLLVLMGSLLFIVPGLIVLTLFFLTPFLVVMKDQSAWKSWQVAFQLGKRNFLPLFGLLLVMSVVEWLIGFTGLFGISMVTSNYAAFLFSQIMLNMIIYPFMVVLITFYVRKWRNDMHGERSPEPLAD
ncbi:hypothetical protein LOK74_14300 [Brevibacillus humidisoli]|uniref:hypothetical protein n=1 Tax=Brevibacillus humidisoli TaxID=2895522 RepID=UPI001E50FAFE|nr:hypothetical protein [Brevibacillus humidisoli]UFJ39241.1 hypothetical protein LOK74_14300 [Brevibacillus humidisoli]